MSFLDMFGGGSNMPVDRLINEYRRHKLGEEVFSRFLDPETKLKRQQMELDIEYKRRQLGLPMDEDLYERSINNDESFVSPGSGTAAVFGRKLGDQIPATGQNPKQGGMLHFMGELGQTGTKYDAANKREFRSRFKDLSKEGILGDLSDALMNERKVGKNESAARNLLRLFKRGIK